jgi:hypothetical protein
MRVQQKQSTAQPADTPATMNSSRIIFSFSALL